MRLRSLAKVNLDLRVIGKRPDGFHELRTIFQTVSLADIVAIEYTSSRRSRIEVESRAVIPDNLLVKAADLVLTTLKQRAHVRFRLDKRIPMGGGLGGGSSNAAAALLALPVLARKPISLEVLLDLAAQLGSDVPFFLLGGTAAGLGRGTELYPLPDGISRPAILITPGIHVSTAAAYQGLRRELTTDVPSRIMNSFQSLAWRIGDTGLGENWDPVNDFETVVFSQYPQLKSIKGKLLRLGARPALMSGSGSTIFGLFESRLQRDRALGSLLSGAVGKALKSENIHPVSLVTRRQYRSLWWRQLRSQVKGNVWPPQYRYAK